jgi:hypothetical protein
MPVYKWNGKGNFKYGDKVYGPGSEIDMPVSDFEALNDRQRANFDGQPEYKPPKLKEAEGIVIKKKDEKDSKVHRRAKKEG